MSGKTSSSPPKSRRTVPGHRDITGRAQAWESGNNIPESHPVWVLIASRSFQIRQMMMRIRMIVVAGGLDSSSSAIPAITIGSTWMICVFFLTRVFNFERPVTYLENNACYIR